jgi:hypothetical protein
VRLTTHQTRLGEHGILISVKLVNENSVAMVVDVECDSDIIPDGIEREAVCRNIEGSLGFLMKGETYCFTMIVRYEGMRLTTHQTRRRECGKLALTIQLHLTGPQ